MGEIILTHRTLRSSPRPEPWHLSFWFPGGARCLPGRQRRVQPQDQLGPPEGLNPSLFLGRCPPWSERGVGRSPGLGVRPGAGESPP